MARAQVTIVNPSKKKKKKSTTRRKKRNASAPKKGKKTMAKRRKSKSRRRRAPARRRRSNPPRRRRTKARASSAAPRRRRRSTRRNPSRFMKVPLLAPIDGTGWRMVGKMASAFAVLRLGDPMQNVQTWPAGSPGYSATSGAHWTLKNDFIGVMGGYLAGNIVAYFKGERAGREVYQGAWDLMVQKFLWTNVFSRWSWTQQQFGAYGYPQGGMGAYGYPQGAFPTSAYPPASMGAMENTIRYDQNGNVWMRSGDSWVSMQGLVEAGPLGGLVEAGPLGHMMTEAGNAQDYAQHTDTGSSDPYALVYQAR